MNRHQVFFVSFVIFVVHSPGRIRYSQFESLDKPHISQPE
jgi:hypothetical protein